MSSIEEIAAGETALAAGEWATAKDAFTAALKEFESPEALDGLGRSLWWMKSVTEGLEARTRAYTAFRREGRYEEAARIAVWLAREHRSLLANEVAADGWLARAKSIADQTADSSVVGWISLAEAEGAFNGGSAIATVHRAMSIARDHNDADLEITALARLALLEIATGKVDAGISHLDEAMTAGVAGEGRHAQSFAEACCALMEAMELLGDNERVAKWGSTLDEQGASFDFGPLALTGHPSVHSTLSPFCGACCGGIYLVTGRLKDAEKELITAIAELESTGLRSRCVHPITQLAELRVVQGRLDEARELLSNYEDLPESVRPLAVLDLALELPAAAAARLRARIDELGRLEVIALPLWAVLVDAELALGNPAAAGGAADEVARIASLTRSGRHDGEAIFARGKVAAARGSAEGPTLLRRAAMRLSEASLPLLACRARMELASALADGDRAVSISEARAALAAFERLGATSDADRAASFLRDLGVRGRTGPKDIGLLSKRELEVLRLVAGGYSNAEIADRLFISVKTAGHHVSNILSKLALRSRTEAAAYAALHLRFEPDAK
jgi:DNA-binding CsgD family transcriptional regulator/tetratricopeptide (TPR) repeat protein